MEARTLLSSVMATNRIVEHAVASSSDIQGYTPAQIAAAYGFNQVALSDGSTAADGSGQTIAIVDAFNDPNIAADLSVFDTQFGLADASLKVVNQTGGSALPKNDAGWAGEIAMDVEWSHAIAPGAKILLVETTSDSTSDLMAGVDYARAAAGVSVVSLSWGGSEFTSFPGSGESSTQTSYDADFTTPAGHQGVTFVAAAGDNGPQAGAEWPASSPNVLSVGGTSLYTSDASGTYSGESGWSSTSSGYSTIEAEPAFQHAVQTTGKRSTADVSYDADPNTGFAVYDSVPDQGTTGWQEVAGTSAGAPQWAALIAIADQGREINGQGTLSGAGQTLPILYNLYNAPGTSGYSSYTQYFNDVSTGGSFRARNGTAAAGYDTLTGLGSPNAPAIVDALTGATYGGRSSTTATSPASPFSTTLIGPTPSAGVIGGAGVLSVKISNISGTVFKGPVTLTVSLSSDGTYSSGDAVVATHTYANFSLGAKGSRRITLKLKYGSALSAGDYTPIASATATNTATVASRAFDPSAIALAAPTADLFPSFNIDPVAIKAGKVTPIAIRIENDGNTTVIGTLSLTIDETTDGAADATAVMLASISNRKIHIAAGKSIVLHTRLAVTADAAGSFALLASLISSTNPADANAANDTAIAQTVSA